MVGTTNAENLARELESDDYRFGAPFWLTAETRDIDRDACRRLSCPICGEPGMAYRPYHRACPDRSYVALAVCPCGHAEQF